MLKQLLTMSAALALPVCATAASAPRAMPIPDPAPNCPYIVNVDGAAVPVEQAGFYSGAYYARIVFDDVPCKVEVKVKATARTFLTLQPERYRTGPPQQDSSTMQFSVSEPGPRVITCVCGSKEIWPLIVFVDKADAAEQELYAADNYEVWPHLSKGMFTQVIQKILDRCAARGGGTVVFRAGVYRTGPLFVKDNTRLLLQPGSVILGSDRAEDYSTDDKWNVFGSKGPTATSPALINFRDCKNSQLVGSGAVDGAGHLVRELGFNMSLVTISGSENISVRNIVLRNSPSWTVHVLGSKKVSFESVKIVADWAVGNTDGINPDCSQDVTISKCFGYCGDDAVAIKTTSGDPKLQGSSNITVRDCLVMTRKTAFKIGTETRKDVSSVLIENCEAINTSRGIGMYIRDGGKVSDIQFKNLKLGLMEYPGEETSGGPYTLSINRREAVGGIDGVTFEAIDVTGCFGSTIMGIDEGRIRNVAFKDCKLSVTNRAIKLTREPVFHLANCDGLVFEGCTVDWQTDQQSLWSGLVQQDKCSQVALDGLKETRPQQ